MISLNELFQKLEDHFGKQDWWPADNKFEIIIGAILTQNVNWGNVEKALDNLRNKNLLNPKGIVEIDQKIIEGLIKPTGFYKQKTTRIKRISKAIINKKGVENFLEQKNLRDKLLSLKGIGPETADCIVLYAAEQPTFVIDSYTKRILNRTEGTKGNYINLQSYFEERLNKNVELFQEFHALLVELGKNYCKTKPKCQECPIFMSCNYFNNS